ncbi:MAG: fatty acid desaturase family protein [Proteobacteria bacterium]|nr:fatty acid desaturase family protein [Pseudomonadota bacterium]
MNVARFDPTDFTPAEMAAVRARSDVTGLLCAIHAWLAIAACMILYALWPNPLTFIFAVIMIGGRQLGLAILMHDAAHGVLTRTRGINEWVGKWIVGYPVGADMISYRHYHLKHHRSTQQPDDPDLGLSAPFPITRSSYRRKFFRDITGQTGFKQRRAQFRNAWGGKDLAFGEHLLALRAKLGGQLATNFILLAILTLLGKPHYYLMFWVLPILTWQMVITRIRNIAEHAVVPDNNDVFRNARTTYASWWERAILAPYWVNYHVDHHLLFYVPCYNLPKLHALLLQKGYGPKMEIRKNYAEILKMATSKPEPLPIAA